MACYQHILVTSDLTPNSEKLALKTKELADKLGAQLSIVHVVEHSPMVYGSGEFAIPLDLELEESLEKEAKERLQRLSEALGINQASRWLLIGSRKEEIVQLAEKINSDLVVVGAHDRHGLGLLFGSTADSILRALPCDILSIRVDE